MRNNFRIPPRDHEPSADALVEAIRAEAALADMDFHEDMALLFESEPDRALRRDFAERYRTLIGVHPEQRDTFRAGLERIRDVGGMPIADLRDAVRRLRPAGHSEK